MKLGALLLEAIEVARLRGDALAGDRRRQIEEQRQIRLQVPWTQFSSCANFVLSRPRPPL
jgi:hypothetical protein